MARGLNTYKKKKVENQTPSAGGCGLRIKQNIDARQCEK